MGAIVNGLALTKVRAFGSGFFIFSDYMREPVRLSALMEIPSIWIFTHDSIGVGEDGPTHQPVEQLASLRAIPGLLVMRPADANEVVEAWRVIMERPREPAVLVLTRGAVPTFDRQRYASAAGLAQGAYVMAEAQGGPPEVLLLGTGSEVALCVAAYEKLQTEGIRARVISMPSWELFEKQSPAYRESVLPSTLSARVVVEAASSFGWARYAGTGGAVLAMETFGASAPLQQLLQKYGFSAEHVVAAAKEQIARVRGAAVTEG
jgi:transketolase